MRRSNRGVSLFFLFLILCLSGAAKADTIEDLVFTGNAQCADTRCVSIGSGTLTGTYTFDVTTQSVVGSWSFLTPFGAISSSEAGAFPLVKVYNGDEYVAFQVVTGNFYDFVQFFFPTGDAQQLGALATDIGSSACLNLPGMKSCDPDYSVTGSTTIAPTPEPSSLILLTSGLLGIVGTRKYRQR